MFYSLRGPPCAVFEAGAVMCRAGVYVQSEMAGCSAGDAAGDQIEGRRQIEAAQSMDVGELYCPVFHCSKIG